MKNTVLSVSIASLFVSSMAVAATPKKVPVNNTNRTNTKVTAPVSNTNTMPVINNTVTVEPTETTTTVAQSYGAPAAAPAPVAGSGFASGLSGRTFSLSATFPGGGSQPIGNALGGRMKMDDSNWIGASVVFSNNTDNAEDTSLFGLSGKLQHFMGSPEKRARPYVAGQLYIWQPSGDANEGQDNMAFGLSGAIGAEVFFIPEFSAFVETGLFLDTSNVDDAETELGTFASAIGVNFNFDM